MGNKAGIAFLLGISWAIFATTIEAAQPKFTGGSVVVLLVGVFTHLGTIDVVFPDGSNAGRIYGVIRVSQCVHALLLSEDCRPRLFFIIYQYFLCMSSGDTKHPARRHHQSDNKKLQKRRETPIKRGIDDRFCLTRKIQLLFSTIKKRTSDFRLCPPFWGEVTALCRHLF